MNGHYPPPPTAPSMTTGCQRNYIKLECLINDLDHWFNTMQNSTQPTRIKVTALCITPGYPFPVTLIGPNHPQNNPATLKKRLASIQ